MTDCAVDTNVVSELSKPRPDPRVIAFLNRRGYTFWLPSIVVYELEYGVEILPRGRQRNLLREAVDGILLAHNNRILPLERTGAAWAARYRAQIQRMGRTPSVGDLLIAGIVKAHNMSLVTRNVRDFDGLDIDLINPWETP